MWEYNKHMCYISPIVKQIRNDHNLMKDFVSEYSMYSSIFDIINRIFENIKLNGDKEDILIIYKKLLENNIVKEEEINILEEWINAIKQYI
jgi:hypothetical protein